MPLARNEWKDIELAGTSQRVSQTFCNRPRRGDLALHPTVKPVALIADLIRDCSKRNGIILDPFGGSGTTILAAERTGRMPLRVGGS
jgi:DNA modification methylase